MKYNKYIPIYIFFIVLLLFLYFGIDKFSQRREPYQNRVLENMTGYLTDSNGNTITNDKITTNESCQTDCIVSYNSDRCDTNNGDYYRTYNVDDIAYNKDTCSYTDPLYNNTSVNLNNVAGPQEIKVGNCDVDCTFGQPTINRCNNGKILYNVPDFKPAIGNGKKCYYKGVEVTGNSVTTNEECREHCTYDKENAYCDNDNHKAHYKIKNYKPATIGNQCDINVSGDTDDYTSNDYCNDCIGSWQNSWSDCKKNPDNGGFCQREIKYIVTTPETNGGKKCKHEDGYKEYSGHNCSGDKNLKTCYAMGINLRGPPQD